MDRPFSETQGHFWEARVAWHVWSEDCSCWSIDWVAPLERLSSRWEEGDGEVQGSMLCIFLKIILGCFKSCEYLFSLTPNLCRTGLFFLCNPLADHPIKSWHISLLLKDTLTTAGNSHPFSARARRDCKVRDCKVSLKHEGERRCRLESSWEWGVSITALEALCRQNCLPCPDHFCLMIGFNSLTSVVVCQSSSFLPCPR